MQYNTMQCNAMQYNAMQSNPMQCNRTQLFRRVDRDQIGQRMYSIERTLEGATASMRGFDLDTFDMRFSLRSCNRKR